MKILLQGPSGKIEAEAKRKGEQIVVSVGDKSYVFSLIMGEGPLYLMGRNGAVLRGTALRLQDGIFLHGFGRALHFEEIADETAAAGVSHSGDLRVIAPMPGTIIKVMVEKGAVVKKGQSLVIVEAMKMENEVRASGEAVVEHVLVAAGERVGFGQELLKLVPHQADGGQAAAS